MENETNGGASYVGIYLTVYNLLFPSKNCDRMNKIMRFVLASKFKTKGVRYGTLCKAKKKQANKNMLKILTGPRCTK